MTLTPVEARRALSDLADRASVAHGPADVLVGLRALSRTSERPGALFVGDDAARVDAVIARIAEGLVARAGNDGWRETATPWGRLVAAPRTLPPLDAVEPWLDSAVVVVVRAASVPDAHESASIRTLRSRTSAPMLLLLDGLAEIEPSDDRRFVQDQVGRLCREVSADHLPGPADEADAAQLQGILRALLGEPADSAFLRWSAQVRPWLDALEATLSAAPPRSSLPPLEKILRMVRREVELARGSAEARLEREVAELRVAARKAAEGTAGEPDALAQRASSAADAVRTRFLDEVVSGLRGGEDRLAAAASGRAADPNAAAAVPALTLPRDPGLPRGFAVGIAVGVLSLLLVPLGLPLPGMPGLGVAAVSFVVAGRSRTAHVAALQKSRVGVLDRWVDAVDHALRSGLDALAAQATERVCAEITARHAETTGEAPDDLRASLARLRAGLPPLPTTSVS